MAKPAPIPSPAVALVDAQGRITPTWFRYLQSRERLELADLNGSLADLADVSDTAPTDGQALVWDDTNSEWSPGTN